jgi:tetratricopeptide (TPR) repeat protein
MMADLDLQTVLATAVSHHNAGRLDEAQAGYRDVLAADPRHAQALHLSGCVLYQKQDHDAGIELIRQALKINPRLRRHTTISGRCCSIAAE